MHFSGRHFTGLGSEGVKRREQGSAGERFFTHLSFSIPQGLLQQKSKELSPAQLNSILDTKQAENPLYLKIVVAVSHFHTLPQDRHRYQSC